MKRAAIGAASILLVAGVAFATDTKADSIAEPRVQHDLPATPKSM